MAETEEERGAPPGGGGGEEESRQYRAVEDSRSDCGGTDGVALAVAGREEYLMSLSCSSGDGRLTGSISQS